MPHIKQIQEELTSNNIVYPAGSSNGLQSLNLELIINSISEAAGVYFMLGWHLLCFTLSLLLS